MLDHSRTSSGKKEPTDINALADEFLRLAYHGFRAKDSDFNVTLQTNFDPKLPKIEIVSQDIGRVVLNLINNAFYAVGQKTKNRPGTNDDGTYVPTVEVSTRGTAAGIEIKVADNGSGIPEALITKVFQPFFTTKPTGEGTGLGLSLSRDIIVNGHGGTLSITSTTEGKDTGTTFTIFLPIINPST
jgi:signal transduction histidine kinase